MNKTQVHLEVKGTEAFITFSTADGLNALSFDVMHTFGAAVAKVKKNRNLRATIVRAEGKVFLAGADAKEISNFSADDAREYARMGQDVLSLLASLPSVTVAATPEGHLKLVRWAARWPE
ncbi:MAG: enoyl-CoA hydratase/isomerase family protein, partial [Planctomycetes bacterium]|nr:enoyl-CoA hydratase/isomerase family protein [Planctomycetota bacterium]